MFCFTDFCQWTYFSNVFTNSTCFALRISANERISVTCLRIVRVLFYGFLAMNVFLIINVFLPITYFCNIPTAGYKSNTIEIGQSPTQYIIIYTAENPPSNTVDNYPPPQHPTPITKKYNRKEDLNPSTS